MRPVRAVSLALLIAVALASPAAAHERRQVGPLEVVVGWAEEPAIAGFQNAVQVSLDGRGADAAELDVVVVFGDGEASTAALPLEPGFDDPTEYRATIVPTRPGSYTFEVSGEVGGDPFDESFSSGADTFDDVRNPTDLEFPAQDPTRGELAQAVERLTERVEPEPVEAETAPSDILARWVAGAALALAVLALVAGRRRGGSRPT